LLQLAPGVNSYNHDGTGLFGGQLKVRGFNSDQIGFTINGAPVNDSGNFAVYPQEYTDSENLCELFVTQGSADTESPHLGASGGNVGMVTCEPNDEFRVKAAQSLGQNRFSRTFARVDTGKFGSAKAYFSVSKSEADKWKGTGKADRDHFDVGVALDVSSDTTFTGSLLYNKAVNNNFLSITKGEYTNVGPNLDFSNVIPQHLTPGAGAQVESGVGPFGTSFTGATSRTTLAYNGYSLNPFKNYLLTTRLATKLNKEVTLSAEPYYWYGYGTGGTQQTTVAETTGTNRLGGGILDINRDGDRLDTIGVYRGSVTQTKRPGITFKANWNFDNHRMLAGMFYERADHRQTQPATQVTNSGAIGDLWLSDPTQLLRRADGTLYQGRDWQTISTAKTLFVQDTISLMNSLLDVTPALRLPSIKRDFTNFASEGSNSGATYNAQRTYSDVLPSLGARFKLDDRIQFFGNINKNMRAPSNFVLSGAVSGGSFVNNALTDYTIKINDSVTKETSVSVEGGIRYSGDTFNASATAYKTNFNNRIATAFDPVTTTTRDLNVGGVRLQGIEADIGTKPSNGFSYYGSISLNQSKIQSDYQNSATTTLATSGKKLPDFPAMMLGASAQYNYGPYLVGLSGKYTASSFSTLVNDEEVPGYTTFNLNAAYRFESTTFFKKPTLRFNMSNIFNKRYLVLNAGSGSNLQTTIDSTKTGFGIPTYYAGAPRFAGITLSSDF